MSTAREAFGAVGPDERRDLGDWLARCGWRLNARTLLWSSTLLGIGERALLDATALQATAECLTSPRIADC